MKRLQYVFVALLVVALAACGSPSSTTADSAGTGEPEPTSVSTSAPVTSSPAEATDVFGPCVKDSGIGDLVGDAGDLFGETQDALATGDIEGFASVAPEQAARYDEVGRGIKAASDCGDTKYGQMVTDLGDVLIDAGTKLSLVTVQSLLADDGSGTAQIQEIAQLISGAGNQMQVLGEYIVEKTS